MHTNSEFDFCPMCGGDLARQFLKEHEPSRLVCSRCSFVFYQDPKLVACALIERDGKVILLKRDIEPEEGKWVMPGGYVDRGEVVEEAALRETEEECGLRIRLTGLLGVYSYPGKVEVVIVYLAEHQGGELVAGDETRAFGCFSLEEIPWAELAFESTRDALDDYLELKKGGAS
jgi:ADP-ribose pyrophosphatase YjhB (NUDIX family)